MNKDELLKIVNKEELRIPELNKNPKDLINVFGYYFDNGWIVYETDERATVYRSTKLDTEEKALLKLLDWLRDQHYIDSI